MCTRGGRCTVFRCHWNTVQQGYLGEQIGEQIFVNTNMAQHCSYTIGYKTITFLVLHLDCFAVKIESALVMDKYVLLSWMYQNNVPVKKKGCKNILHPLWHPMDATATGHTVDAAAVFHVLSGRFVATRCIIWLQNEESAPAQSMEQQERYTDTTDVYIYVTQIGGICVWGMEHQGRSVACGLEWDGAL